MFKSFFSRIYLLLAVISMFLLVKGLNNTLDPASGPASFLLYCLLISGVLGLLICLYLFAHIMTIEENKTESNSKDSEIKENSDDSLIDVLGDCRAILMLLLLWVIFYATV